MKKIVFIILLIFPFLIKAQIINFPDVNLKNRLLQASPNNEIARTNWSIYNPSGSYQIAIDVNNDGEIDVAEALQVYYLSISGQSISDLTGLEYFSNLRWLGATYNQITQISLATLTNLQSLFISNNQLNNIDLTGLMDLNIFTCDNNQITSLDFSEKPNLKRVYCGHNQLTS